MSPINLALVAYGCGSSRASVAQLLDDLLVSVLLPVKTVSFRVMVTAFARRSNPSTPTSIAATVLAVPTALALGVGLWWLGRQAADRGQPLRIPVAHGLVPASQLGFAFPDCHHMRVTDEAQFAVTAKHFFERLAASEDPQLAPSNRNAADTYTRAFFAKYFERLAPACLPDAPAGPEQSIAAPPTTTPGQAYAFPVDVPLSQKLMYGFMFLTFGLELHGTGWGDETFASELMRLDQWLRQAGLDEDVWNEVFMGTVAWPQA